MMVVRRKEVFLCWLARVHGDEAFAESLLVVGVESTPEDGIVLPFSHPT